MDSIPTTPTIPRNNERDGRQEEKFIPITKERIGNACTRCKQKSIVIIEMAIFNPIRHSGKIVGDEFLDVQYLCNGCMGSYWRSLSSHKCISEFFPSMVFCKIEEYFEIRDYCFHKAKKMQKEDSDDMDCVLTDIERLSI
jgi:hypothetical protein